MIKGQAGEHRGVTLCTTEIEAKLKVDSLEDGRTAGSRECGASFLRETMQTDRTSIRPTDKLTRPDECLRLRHDKTAGGERLILAYKGPKEQDDYKKRVELEIEVNDAGTTELLLAALGYRKALAFNKRRRLWELHGCEVALDELPLLGIFVEIEGPDSGTIARVQEMLGLSGSASYHGQLRLPDRSSNCPGSDAEQREGIYLERSRAVVTTRMSFKIGNMEVGLDAPLFLMAGPCVIESEDICLRDRRAAGADLRVHGSGDHLQGQLRQGQPQQLLQLPRSRAGRGHEDPGEGPGRERVCP